MASVRHYIQRIKEGRLKQIMGEVLWMYAYVRRYWLLIGGVTWFLRTPMVALFVSGEGAAQVIALGSEYLGYMALFYALPALTNGFQGFYRGMGKMTTTLVGTCLQAGLRALGAALLAPRMGLPGIAWSCAFGWSVMLLFEIPYYFHTCRKQDL